MPARTTVSSSTQGALTAAKGAADRAVAAGHGPDGLPRLATVLRTGKSHGTQAPSPETSL